MNVTKKITVALMALLCVVFTAFAASCDSQVEISFETNGVAAVESVKVKKDEEYTLPTASAVGYEFLGWYDSAEYTGSAVTTIKASANVKYYAKWEKLAKITLDLDGGTASADQVYVKVGTSLLDGLNSVTPTKSGYQFGRWLLNGKEVTSSTKAADGLTVKADYKVGYTIEVYLESLDGSNYEKKEESVLGYDYIQKNYTPSYSELGFVQTTVSGDVVKKDLTSNVSDNVYKIYYNRKTIEVSYRPEYPDGTESKDITDTLKFGQTKSVEAQNVKCDGYVLLGWATEKGGEVVYSTNFFNLDGVVFNHEGDYGTPDSLSALTEDIVLYGKWLKGSTDMLGGNDYVYRLSDDDDSVYLCRDGIYFKGQCVDNDFSFRVVDDETGKEKEIFNGRLVGNDKFIFGSLDRASLVFSYYDNRTSGKVDENVSILFGEFNDLVYNDKTTNEQSKGEYIINDSGYYEANFTEGPLAGTSMIFAAGYVTDSSSNKINVFVKRDEEEVSWGRLHRFYINSSNEIDYRYIKDGLFDIELDGFSTATFYSYDSSTGEIVEATYMYTSNSNNNLITLSSSSSGKSVGVIKLMDVVIDGDTIKGYDFYTSTEALTYNSGDSTLTLDGTFNATYFNGTDTLYGYYEVTESILGNVVTFVDKTSKETYTFLTSSVTSQKVTTDSSGNEKTDTVTEYIFEVKANGYSAYLYSDASGKYRAPMLVINDTAVGEASLYAYSKKGTYIKVSSGTVTETDGKYVYTADEFYEVTEEVFETLMKIQDVKSVVYNVQDEYVYFYSYLLKDATESTDLTTAKVVYTLSGSSDTLTTFAGYLFYKNGGDESIASYSVDESTGLIVATINSVKTYFEVNDDDKTFVKLLYAPYTVSLREANGSTTSTDETLYFDGKGGAVYSKKSSESSSETIEYEFKYEGTVTESGKSKISGTTVYSFAYTTEAGKTQFEYILLSSSSNTYFTKYSGDEDGDNTYVSDYGVLTLDGYGFRVNYTDADGKAYENCSCAIQSETVVVVLLDGAYRYFDLNNEDYSFTIRGTEYGARIYVDNQNLKGIYLEFDGYETVKVFEIVSTTDEDGNATSERSYIDENGTYQKIGESEYRISYTDGADSVIIEGKLSTVTSSSYTYATFVKTYSEIISTYVNPDDLSVVRLDGNGNVVKTLKTGRKQSGQYVIVTDSLIYFVNDDGTDACLYSYDKLTGTIKTVTDNYVNMAFYTSDLESFKFSKYGYAVFDGSTRYYYVIDETGNYIIYRYAKDDETANKYGFVSELFCTQEEYLAFTEGEVKVYQGKSYYYADGWGIEFNRTEDNKENYPVSVTTTPKKPIEKLVFSPGGSDEFAVTGTVTVNDNNYSCTVYKVAVKNSDGEATGEYETYIYLSGYRFDIKLNYLGITAEGDSRSTYDVTAMSYSRYTYAYNYLDLYYMAYLYFGSTVASRIPNGYGSITYKATYNEDGSIASEGYDCVFGSYAGFYDLNGDRFPTVENATYGTDSYGYSYLEMTGTDGYTYRLHYYKRTHSAFNMKAYSVIAFTRVQTFDNVVENYNATVEKVVYSEVSQFAVGSVYSIDLVKKEVSDGVATESKIAFSATATYNGIWYGIYRYRDKDDNGKITNTVYYEFGFIDNDDAYKNEETEAVLSVASYKSVSMTIRQMKTYYWVSGENMYVDVDGTNNTIFLLYSKSTTSSASYIVTEQSYDESTKTYTITAGGKQYTVVLNSEDQTAVITAITADNS